MIWVAIVAWIVAVVVAILVLGFAGYEIWWRTNRLRADAGRLTALAEQLQQIQGDLSAARARLPGSGHD